MRPSQRSRFIALAVATALFVGAAGGPYAADVTAQPVAASDDKAVTLNFVNADLPAVIKAAAEITGRDVLIDPRVTGAVTIITPKPVPRSLVWNIMLSAIRAQGFTAVGSESGVARIVPEADAKFFGGPVGRQRGAGDQIVTEVFVLENERAQQLVPVLRPLMSPNNVVNAAPAANALIVTDYAENLERIRRVIAEVDRPVAGEIIAIQLKHAAAADFMQIVQRLVPDAASTAAARGLLRGWRWRSIRAPTRSLSGPTIRRLPRASARSRRRWIHLRASSATSTWSICAMPTRPASPTRCARCSPACRASPGRRNRKQPGSSVRRLGGRPQRRASRARSRRHRPP